VGQDCIPRAGLLPAQYADLEIGAQVENLPNTVRLATPFPSRESHRAVKLNRERQ
jgi:hypothetical protein